MSKLSTVCHFPSKMSCDSLVLLGPCVTWPMCALGAGVFKFVVQLSHSLILVTESSHMASHGKELSEDLKDMLRNMKRANTLKLSCSTVAKIIQRFKSAVST